MDKIKYLLSALLLSSFAASSAFAANCDILTHPGCEVIPTYYYELSKNGLPTQIIFHNKGAYVAKYRLTYQEYKGGPTKVYNSPHLASGKKASLVLPAAAWAVSASAEFNTGLIWDRWGEIYYAEPLCSQNNKWTANDGSKNIIQIDNWGTTLGRGWALQRPSGVHSNGAEGYRCW